MLRTLPKVDGDNHDTHRGKSLVEMSVFVATNVLTIDATDPKSGTAEFKASAIRVEKLPSAAAVAR